MENEAVLLRQRTVDSTMNTIRNRRVFKFLRLCLPLAFAALGCRPDLDNPAATLPVPSSLPPFAALPQPLASLGQSQALLDRARDALQAGRKAQALPLLTEALATCPASTDARFELARYFANHGRASVAVQLLAPAKAAMATCGTCVELLQNVRNHPEFAHLSRTEAGSALLADVPTEPLPYAKWSTAVAKALQSGEPAKFLPFIHGEIPYDLVRSCPQCTNPTAREIQRRPLFGEIAAAKLAQRFDSQNVQAGGLPLDLPGDPTCSDRCCDWNHSLSTAPNRVTLQRICLWPVTPTRAAVRLIALRYGPTER